MNQYGENFNYPQSVPEGQYNETNNSLGGQDAYQYTQNTPFTNTGNPNVYGDGVVRPRVDVDATGEVNPSL